MNLPRAIEIAVLAHSGQTDKAGAPYILHPLRVMFALQGNDAQIVGVLHDVVEDCPGWTFDRLRAEGFSQTVLRALASVTRNEDTEDYAAFVARAAADAIGRQVKRADVLDNLNGARLSEMSPKDLTRFNRYLKALAVLDRT
jgi:(p)ppGpp synthase/HD superfamily hydrolase